MVKINKIYTKNGDSGNTQLVGGESISKSSIRICSVGDIDELNSYLGMLRTLLVYNADFSKALSQIQNDLFDIGCIVSTPHEKTFAGMRVISETNIQFLEDWIDSFSKNLAELKSFVLPGGNMLNSFMHISRAVCRRAERNLWKLNESEAICNNVLVYMNRLSDFLFAFSRFEIHRSGGTEYLWK